MKKSNLFKILLPALFFFSLFGGLKNAAQAQEEPLFDLVWSCFNHSENPLLPAKNLPGLGSEITVSAQPSRKTALGEYEFLWYLDRVFQKDFSGQGRNVMIFQMTDAGRTSEINLQIKRSGQTVQTVNLRLLPRAPEILLYPALLNSPTNFYFSKAATGELTIQEGTNYLFKLITRNLPEMIAAKFKWEMGETQTDYSYDSSFLLSIPAFSSPKQKTEQQLKVTADFGTGLNTISRQLRLLFQ